MMSTKILVASAAIVVVASAALLVPGIASGISPVPGAPWVLVGSTGDGPDGEDVNGDGPGSNGRGHAYGHDKDSEDFPGDHGRHNDDDDAEDDESETR